MNIESTVKSEINNGQLRAMNLTPCSCFKQSNHKAWSIKGDNPIEEIARLKRTIAELEIENRTDVLTGLLNRRGFIYELNMAWDSWVRYGVPTTLMMLDMNRFKQINDTYGHETGDQALKMIAIYLQNNLRSIDIISRLGGDEFAIILPHTDADKAGKIVDKLFEETPSIQSISDEKIDSINLHFSLGFTELDTRIGSPKSWLHAADKEMYFNKVASDVIRK